MFTPGEIVKTFTSKKGNTVVLRLAKREDLQSMTDFINQASREDTFISLSGEQLTIEEEAKYLNEVLEKMAKGEAVKLFVFVNDALIGSADITRMQRRSQHVGLVGIIIKKEYRAEGIGKAMIETLFNLAQKMGLLMLELSCFANNTTACNLYTSVGFEKVGRIPQKLAYKGEYIDSIVMVKDLTLAKERST